MRALSNGTTKMLIESLQEGVGSQESGKLNVILIQNKHVTCWKTGCRISEVSYSKEF